MYFDDIDYARGRLVNTIIRFGEEPVRVDAISSYKGKFRVKGRFLVDDKEISKYIEEMNLESPPLGYINLNKSAAYITRKPMRHDWRQGIRPENLNWVGLDLDPLWEFPFKQIRDTIVGEYPSLRESREMLKEGNKELVAFSRDFAVSPAGILHYKGKTVGIFNVVDAVVNLYDRFKYLTEYVEEVCHA